MTAAEISAKAVTLAESRMGSCSPAKIEAKAASGLVEGDAVRQGDVRVVYAGGTTVRRERLTDGTWTTEATMEMTDEQRDGLLVQVAAEAGALATTMGRL